jgi:hypothetical protein
VGSAFVQMGAYEKSQKSDFMNAAKVKGGNHDSSDSPIIAIVAGMVSETLPSFPQSKNVRACQTCASILAKLQRNDFVSFQADFGNTHIFHLKVSIRWRGQVIPVAEYL